MYVVNCNWTCPSYDLTTKPLALRPDIFTRPAREDNIYHSNVLCNPKVSRNNSDVNERLLLSCKIILTFILIPSCPWKAYLTSYYFRLLKRWIKRLICRLAVAVIFTTSDCVRTYLFHITIIYKKSEKTIFFARPAVKLSTDFTW